jgi:hypothetical protein
MTKPLQKIYRLQPLQLDTAILTPMSYIRGTIGAPFNIVGTALAALVTPSRVLTSSLPTGKYQITVTTVGAVGVGAYTVTDLTHGLTSAAVLTSATAQTGLIPGVSLIVSSTTGTAVGDSAEFDVDGDQTWIIPGTVLGRYSSGANQGKWAPAYDDTIANFDIFRVANGFQETNKQALVPYNSREAIISDQLATSVIVFGTLSDANCRLINLTNNLKAQLTGIVWE